MTSPEPTHKQAAEAAAHYAAIVKSSQDAIIGQEPDGTVTSWNPAAEKIFGYATREIIGHSLKRIIPAERHDEEERILRRIARGEAVQHFETVRMRKDGSNFDVSVTASPIQDAAGRIIGVSKMVRDITEHKRLERELRRNELELRTITDHAPEIIGRFDRQLRHIFINPAITGATGKTVEEYIGKTNLELGHPPEICALWTANFNKVFETRQPSELDFSFETPNGVKHYHSRTTPEFGSDGTVGSVVFVSADVTEIKRAERLLRENEERQRLLLKHSPAAIAMLDREMRYIVTSEHWLKQFGIPEQELRGRGHYEIFPEIPERWREIHRHCLAGAIERADADRFERADGRVQWVQWEVRPWYLPSGSVGGIVIFNEDITERKVAEEALQESRDRLSLALGAARMASFEWDIVKNTRHWDDNAHRLFGTNPKTFAGMPEEFFRVIHPEDRTGVQAALAKAVQTGTYTISSNKLDY